MIFLLLYPKDLWEKYEFEVKQKVCFKCVEAPPSVFEHKQLIILPGGLFSAEPILDNTHLGIRGARSFSIFNFL